MHDDHAVASQICIPYFRSSIITSRHLVLFVNKFHDRRHLASSNAFSQNRLKGLFFSGLGSGSACKYFSKCLIMSLMTGSFFLREFCS